MLPIVTAAMIAAGAVTGCKDEQGDAGHTPKAEPAASQEFEEAASPEENEHDFLRVRKRN